MKYKPSTRGVSLVEVIITAAIITLIFGALLVGAQSMLQLVSRSKAKAAALSVASTQMEYLRSFAYDDLGTVGGVPNGPILQNSTTTLNNITFNVRTLVQYIDDAADGVGASDENAILADYKQIKVEVTWNNKGKADSLALTSSVVPPGIETTDGGGTIRVNVFDTNVQPVAGAEVRFVNTTATSTIDTVRYTNSEGVAYLAGALAISDYEISVSQTGYSTDGTYKATSINPNPTTLPVAVLAGQVSTMNFQIDELSSFKVTAKEVPAFSVYSDTFSSTGDLMLQASTTVSSGSVRLTDMAGVYAAEGTVRSTTTKPTTIDHWYKASISASTTVGTELRVSVTYDNGSGVSLVPDSILPGNSAGFTSFPIDLTSVSATTYNALGLQAVLTSSTGADTPYLNDWSLTYVELQPTVSGVDMTMTGTRLIGTYDDGSAVIKNTHTGTTDVTGEWVESAVEFDSYIFSMDESSYRLYQLCPTSPVSVPPGTTVDMVAMLGPYSSNLLRVNVTEVDGSPIADASVRLQNNSIDISSVTTLCGQTAFGSGLYEDDNYLLTVSAPGYTTKNLASTTVSTDTSITVVLD